MLALADKPAGAEQTATLIYALRTFFYKGKRECVGLLVKLLTDSASNA